MIKLINGDCLVEMASIEDGSIDMILCDLPFQITKCHWDKLIPFEPLWAHYKRIIKPNGAIVLFGSQPFTSALVMSNPKMFRYDLKWIKESGTGFYNANRMPLRAHEDILIFYKKLPAYNPQKSTGKPYIAKRGSSSDVYAGKDLSITNNVTGDRHPLSWTKFKRDSKKLHPTQKPVPLLEYLIKTYTNEGETVLDNCFGSCSTGVACLNTNRSFIGIEMDKTYFDIGSQRMLDAQVI